MFNFAINSLFITKYGWFWKEKICPPTVSKVWAIGMTPLVETTPCEGRIPKIPQYEAGTLTLPPVSVPAHKHYNGHHHFRIMILHDLLFIIYTWKWLMASKQNIYNPAWLYQRQYSVVCTIEISNQNPYYFMNDVGEILSYYYMQT